MGFQSMMSATLFASNARTSTNMIRKSSTSNPIVDRTRTISLF